MLTPTHPAAGPVIAGKTPITAIIRRIIAGCERIPHAWIALLARFSIAAIFWQSGQTKIEGLAINFISGEFSLGWPRLSESALTLFEYEYQLPLISPALAAPMAALAEHIFPLLILAGLATRFSAFALLVMTVVIQLFVYPGAYATHGVWAAVLLVLIARGPGTFSLDYLLAKRNVAVPSPH